jgi:hypothetical protein
MCSYFLADMMNVTTYLRLHSLKSESEFDGSAWCVLVILL